MSSAQKLTHKSHNQAVRDSQGSLWRRSRDRHGFERAVLAKKGDSGDMLPLSVSGPWSPLSLQVSGFAPTATAMSRTK